MSANQQPRWLSWIGSGSCCPKCMGPVHRPGMAGCAPAAPEPGPFVPIPVTSDCDDASNRLDVCPKCMGPVHRPVQTMSTARENDRWFTLFAASLDEARHALAFQHWPIAIWAEKRDEAIALAANFADAALIEARKRGRL